jgi:hypothetical protein
MDEKARRKISIGEDVLASFLPGGDTISALQGRQGIGELIGNGLVFNATSFPVGIAHLADSLKKGRAMVGNVGGKAKVLENPKNVLQRLLLQSAVGGTVETAKKRIFDRD